MGMSYYEASHGPVVLCILDGWGWRTASANNAVALANTPVFDGLMATRPHSFLAASGADVGLPDGQVGNSEVGHMNIGAGRVVMQDLPLINEAVADGTLAAHPALTALADKVAATGNKVHVMGLLSPGGVHAHQAHFLAVITGLTAAGATVAVHGFTDGRDTLPRAAAQDLPAFFNQLPERAFMVSLTGRYYAMDRDKRWERTARAYAAIRHGVAPFHDSDAVSALAAAYNRNEGDEFVSPTLIGDYAGMIDGDALVMMNFRADRARQLLSCFCDAGTVGFETQPVSLAGMLGMTSYSAALDANMTALYPSPGLSDTLGAVVAAAGKTQLRLAETEKYPHVTFFLMAARNQFRKARIEKWCLHPLLPPMIYSPK